VAALEEYYLLHYCNCIIIDNMILSVFPHGLRDFDLPLCCGVQHTYRDENKFLKVASQSAASSPG